jgi:hypothetical protein
MIRYVPPFDLVRSRFAMASSKGKIFANIGYDELRAVIGLLLRGVEVDEAWYLATYPDIAEAIAAGVVTSAKAHFIENGYFEGRMPFPLEVDEEWYCGVYPDIAVAIARGDFESASSHFREFGYPEGRLPGAVG